MIVGLGLGVAASSHITATLVVDAEVIRVKKGIVAVGNAQVDTAQSKFGSSSALFDGTIDYLKVSPAISLGTGDFTIECWIRPSVVTGIQVIYDDRPIASSKHILFYMNGTSIYYYSTGNNITGSIPTANTWYHIAVSRSSSVVKMFINGTQAGSDYTDTGDKSVNSYNDFIIGQNSENRTTDHEFTGWIDEFRISNTARYTTGFTPSTTPFVNDENTLLLLHMDGTDASTVFEDDNGAAIVNYSDDAYAEYLKLAVTMDGVSGVQDIAPKINTALTNPASYSLGTNVTASTAEKYWSNYTSSSQFTGGASALIYTLPSTMPSSSSGTFVIEGWFKPTATGTNWCISSADTGGRFLFSLSTGASNAFSTSEGNLNYITLTAGWHHIAIVCDGGTKRLYRNGIYVAAWLGGSSGFTNLHLGQFNAGDANDYDGYIQDFRIYQGTNRGYTGTNTGSANFTLPSSIFVSQRTKKGITAIGNAQVDTAQSKFGGSSYLGDGTGDYLNVGETSDFGFGTGNFTVEAWIYNTKASSTRKSGILSKRNFDNINAGGWGLYLTTDDGKIGWEQLFSGGTTYEISGTVSSSTWTHIAVVRNGTTMKIYNNGTEQASWTDSTNYTNVNQLKVGTFWDSTQGNIPTNSVAWQGNIDEVRVSNTARYTGNFTPATAPFVNDANTLLLLHMDGTDAVTYFEDDTGASTPGRTQKHISYYGNAQIDTAQSKFGGSSALFDGTGDYLSIASNSDFTFSGDFTIEFWWRVVDTTTALIPFFNTSTHLFYIGQASGPKYAVFQGGSNRLLSSALTVSNNTWYHCAFVRSGSTLKAYHNGTEVASVTHSTTVTTGNPNTIGSYTSYYLNGHLDEVRVSNTARYTENFTPSTTAFQDDADTVLLLHFDGADASTTFVDDIGGRVKTSLIANGTAQIDTAQSQFGGSSLLLDGNSDWISTANQSSMWFVTGDYTIECWIRAASLHNGIIASQTISNSGWSFFVTSDGKIHYQQINPSGGYIDFSGYVSKYSANTWVHIAFVRNGTGIATYVNGSRDYNATSSARPAATTGNLQIGKGKVFESGGFNSGDVYFNGHIDELRISNIARYSGTTYDVPTEPFQNDTNTLLLLHMDGTDGLKVFTDDNGVPPDYDYGA